MSEETFDAPVWHNGKALRKGYTTGSCATAAAKVAALMVMRQHIIHQVSIVTPPASRCALTLSPRTLKGSRRSPLSVKTAAMMSMPPTAC
jgi:cobalt-precorrin-5B (C1)-methyltransferase